MPVIPETEPENGPLLVPLGLFQDTEEHLESLPSKETEEFINALKAIRILPRAHVSILERRAHRDGLDGIRILPFSREKEKGIRFTLQGASSEFFACLLSVERVSSYQHYGNKLLTYLEAEEKRPHAQPLSAAAVDEKRKPEPSPPRPPSPRSVKINRQIELKRLLAKQETLGRRVRKTEISIRATKRSLEELEKALENYKSYLLSDEASQKVKDELESLNRDLNMSFPERMLLHKD